MKFFRFTPIACSRRIVRLRWLRSASALRCCVNANCDAMNSASRREQRPPRAHGGALQAVVDEVAAYDFALTAQQIAVIEPPPDSINPSPVTTTVYDLAGRGIQTINPLGFITTTSYDNANRKIAITDAELNTTTTLYDNDSRTIALTDANNHTITTVYDPANRKTGLINANGYMTTFIYDFANRKINEINADGGISTIGYEILSKVVDGVKKAAEAVGHLIHLP